MYAGVLTTSKPNKECTLADTEVKYPIPDGSEAEGTKIKANKRKAMSRFKMSTRFRPLKN